MHRGRRGRQLAERRRPRRVRVRAGVRTLPELRHGPSATCATSAASLRPACRSSDGTSAPPRPTGKTSAWPSALLGTFAHHTVVNEASCIKIDKDVPLDRACLLGCGVVTGWGSAVYAAEVSPGDTVAVVGIGGIGSNAIQGAKLAGARVHRRHRPRRVQAREGDGVRRHAHLRVDRRGDAGDRRQHVGHDGFDKVIMTMGVGNGEVLGEAFWLGGKRGKIVVTNIHPVAETVDRRCRPVRADADGEAARSARCSARPTRARTSRSCSELYTQGQLDLDGLVTTHVPARRDQRRLRRHERRQEHPRRAGLRVTSETS